jgi:hypothetical protein
MNRTPRTCTARAFLAGALLRSCLRPRPCHRAGHGRGHRRPAGHHHDSTTTTSLRPVSAPRRRKKLIAEFMAANPNMSLSKACPIPAPTPAASRPTSRRACRSTWCRRCSAISTLLVEQFRRARRLRTWCRPTSWPPISKACSPNGTAAGGAQRQDLRPRLHLLDPCAVLQRRPVPSPPGSIPTSPPKTWACGQDGSADHQGKDRCRWALPGASSVVGAADWLFQGVVRSNNGEVISRDRKTLKFAEPEAVEAVQMLRDLADAGAYENYGFQRCARRTWRPASSPCTCKPAHCRAGLVAGAKDKYELRSSTMPQLRRHADPPEQFGFSALTIHTA